MSVSIALFHQQKEWEPNTLDSMLLNILSLFSWGGLRLSWTSKLMSKSLFYIHDIRNSVWLNLISISQQHCMETRGFLDVFCCERFGRGRQQGLLDVVSTCCPKRGISSGGINRWSKQKAQWRSPSLSCCAKLGVLKAVSRSAVLS